MALEITMGMISQSGWLKMLMLFASLTGIFSFAEKAQAFGVAPGGCGTLCMAQSMGPIVSPYYGLPFYPSSGANFDGRQGYGQMRYGIYGDINPALYTAASMSWTGAQGMGMSYLPPMGMEAISNSIYYRQSAPTLEMYRQFYEAY